MGLAFAKVHREPDRIRSRLAELGLTEQLLIEVVSEGEAARGSATPLDPLNAPGQLAYIGRIRALRMRLLPMGWTKEDPMGCALTVSPCGTKQIMVATGDDGTGLDTLPSTQYPKGFVLERAVDRNKQLQRGLWPEFDEPNEVSLPVALSRRETWLFLIRRVEMREPAKGKELVEIRSELSLPAAMTQQHPTEWSERIVLPVQTLDPSGGGQTPPSFTDGDDIDVPITRK